MKIITDAIAMRTLQEYGLSRYGIEFGNWFGFIGIPLNYGLCSFLNIEEVSSTDEQHGIIARVKMPYLHTRINYLTSKIEGGIVTELRMKALDESLLGDIVIHSVFDHYDKKLEFNNTELTKVNKYIYSNNTCNEIYLNKRVVKIEMELDGCDGHNMKSMPYATIISGNKVRYHSRAISMGGRNSRALLRTRGALSCFNLGKYRSFYDNFLYRVEKKSPNLFRNTQICSVIKLLPGDEIVLRHKITIS